MISVETAGSFDKTLKFLEFMKSGRIFDVLNHYGPVGVDALSRATPRDTGLAASSWKYEVVHKPGMHAIYWSNTDNEGGLNIAVIIQYGHGTGTGGYVEGIDYINPALRPIFDKILEDVWRQVRDG